MGKGGFDKFAWIRAVVGDRRLKVGERFVLTNIAIRYVRYGDDVFRVRQTTITEHFAVGERLVGKSLSQGRQLGYLVLAQERQRGRGYHGPDEHRLVIPADRAAIKDGIPAQNDRNTGTDRPEYRHEITEIPARADVTTSENYTPKGSLKGSLEGSVEGSGPPPSIPEPENPQPPRYCSKHPHGTDRGCIPCRDAREAHKAWEGREAEARTTEAAGIRAAIDDCTDCDDYGRLDDFSDCPKHPNFRRAA
jgi:hypothetical protein